MRSAIKTIWASVRFSLSADDDGGGGGGGGGGPATELFASNGDALFASNGDGFIVP